VDLYDVELPMAFKVYTDYTYREQLTYPNMMISNMKMLQFLKCLNEKNSHIILKDKTYHKIESLITKQTVDETVIFTVGVLLMLSYRFMFSYDLGTEISCLS